MEENKIGTELNKMEISEAKWNKMEQQEQKWNKLD